MNDKKIAGEKAIEFIEEGMTLGLGTGSTVYFTIMKLGELVRKGFRVTSVSTSFSTTKLAEAQGIKVIDFNDVERVDLTIDGADEVDTLLNGIKGGGGALLYEKIVASISDKVIWVIDSSKIVKQLGSFPLPVEAVPFGYKKIFNKLNSLGLNPVLRMREKFFYLTDSGNYIMDLHIGKIVDALSLERQLKTIPGIVECGLFINMTDTVIVGKNGKAEVLSK